MWFCDKDLSSLDSINWETHKGKYMEQIQEIYLECIRNLHGISINIYDQKPRPNGAAAEGGACVSDHKYLWICLVYSLYIPYIFHIYFLAMFHIFSLVCFLIYGVKRRQVLIAKQRFTFTFSDATPFIFFMSKIMNFLTN